MSEEVRVNIRPRFDFDSYAPVQGIVKDEAKEAAQAAMWYFAITNTAAIAVSLFGFWLMSWWIHGGYTVATGLVAKYLPSFWLLVKSGMMSG